MATSAKEQYRNFAFYQVDSAWRRLPKEEREGSKKEFSATYSFGLDDQEFVVALESDRPADFVELIMALRETEASRFTLCDTPIFTCIQKTIHETQDDLG